MFLLQIISDFTISDFVSDMRASTPSHAAEMVTLNQDEVIQYIEEMIVTLDNRVFQNCKINKEIK